MKRFNMMKAILLMAFACAVLNATSIPPTSNPTGPISGISGTTLSGLTLVVNENTALSGALAGGLESAVYKTGSGNLDFFYQIHQTGSQIQYLSVPIGTIDGSLNVFYVNPPPSPISPFTTQTSTDGIPAYASNSPGPAFPGHVTFDLSAMPSTGSATSVIFEIQTSDKAYKTDSASFFSVGSLGLLTASAGTYSPVPEPGFYGCLAAGLAGLFWVASRRARRPASSRN